MLGCACKSREGPALKNVLFAWELGRGLGHLMNMRRIAARLKPHGVRFIAVSRDPAAAGLLARMVERSLVRKQISRFGSSIPPRGIYAVV